MAFSFSLDSFMLIIAKEGRTVNTKSGNVSRETFPKRFTKLFLDKIAHRIV